MAGRPDEDVRNEILAHAALLRERGPQLGRPYVDTVEGSAFTNMKELRVQFRGDPGESSSPSIPTGRPSCWSAATSGATNAGTKKPCRSPMSDFGGTWNACNSEENMAIRLDDYTAKLPDKQRQAINERAAELIAEEATLRQLREARERSQEAVAEQLHIKQAAVSKLERRTDMYLSTLRGYIEAMGGKLEIIARFPGQAVRITQFEELDPRNGRSGKEAWPKTSSRSPIVSTPRGLTRCPIPAAVRSVPHASPMPSRAQNRPVPGGANGRADRSMRAENASWILE